MAALLTIGSLTANAQSDYQEIDLSTVTTSVLSGSPTLSGKTISFTNGGGTLGIDVSKISVSSYKYLVIVPRKPFRDGIDIAVNYGFIDGADTPNNIWYEGYTGYNTFREFTYNLTANAVYYNCEEKSKKDFKTTTSSTTIDLSKLKTIYFTSGAQGDYEISSIFLTSNKPSYNNVWNLAYWQYEDYRRAITTENTYGTVCLPYAASICGAYAYEVAGVDKSTSPTKLYLKEVTGLLKAGTPYIFKTNTALDASDVNKGGYVTFLRASTNAETAPVAATGLVGSFEDNKSVPDDCYILTNNTWAKGKSNVIDANRAYLNLTGLTVITGGAASYTAVDLTGGVVTGINAVKSDKTDSKTVYNLNGMSVSNPTKGLYIENGKKVIIK